MSAAVLVTAAALLAGCSSASGEGAGPASAHHTAASHSRSAAPATTAPPASGDDRPGTTGPSDEDGPTTAPEPEQNDPLQDTRPSGPTVPKAELTPATGSFDKKQKEYLADRVPEGMDPAAVLAAGQETCERITRTAKVDRKAAVDAIRSGEIGGAKAAITHLCPQHKDLLRAAAE